MKAGENSIMLGGDFNLNFNSDTKFVNLCTDLFASYNMYSQVSDVTRVSSTAATKIENVFWNINSCKPKVDKLRLSDHKAFIRTMNASYKLEEYYIERRCNINEKSITYDFENQKSC